MDSDLHSTPNHRVKLNVGGKHVETTLSTLRQTPISISITTAPTTPIFFDADPHHITTLLSTARTHPNHLPPFTPYDSSHTTTLTPPLSPLISTFSPPTTLPLLLAHNNLISHYHPTTLTHLSTIPTHLPLITSISPLSSTVSAVASSSSFSPPGLHFFSDHHLSTLLWSDPTDLRTLSSHVTSLTSSTTHLFSSFKTRHAENTILVIDKTTLKTSSEIGRQSGNTSKSAALTKLTWVNDLGVLVGSSVTCTGFGYSGYVRMWDVRSGKAVWETGVERRLGDMIADVDVDEESGWMAKVGSRSGDVGIADLRKLGGGGGGNEEDPWVYLEEANPCLRGAGPVKGSVVVCCWDKHVFVGRDGELEAWSMVSGRGVEGYRRNFMDKEEEDEKKGTIKMIGGGGNRLFVARDNVEGLEVWETSTSSGVITLS